jgi:hypothetical protein
MLVAFEIVLFVSLQRNHKNHEPSTSIISSINQNFFHRHKNTQTSTLRFGSKLLPSSLTH